MSVYPTGIYSHRDIENLPGQEYDPEKKTTLFVEDILKLADEITAIQELLGVDPLDGYASFGAFLADVVERLEALEAGGGGGPTYHLTHDGTDLIIDGAGNSIDWSA